MTPTTKTAISLPAPTQKFRLRLPDWLRNNPIILKEMQSRMRGWRSLSGILAFVILLSGIVTVIYSTFTTVNRTIGLDSMRELGRGIYFTVYGIELLVVCMVAPALTASAISSEKEQQTYDLIRTTLLSAKALVTGKLIAALSFALLFILTALPLQSIGFMFGGITLEEVLVGLLILVFTTLTFGTIGIFYSSFLPKSRIATGAAQITSIALTILIPTMVFFAMLTLDNQINLNNLTFPVQRLLISLIWLVAAFSPVATIIGAEIFLTQEQALFYTQTTLTYNGPTIYIPSPWLGFAVIYPILTLILLYVTIRIVRRTER